MKNKYKYQTSGMVFKGGMFKGGRPSFVNHLIDDLAKFENISRRRAKKKLQKIKVDMCEVEYEN